jgi:hypothetical protein
MRYHGEDPDDSHPDGNFAYTNERVAEVLAVHINFGQSEDMMRGFNLGYDDAASGTVRDPGLDAPADDPWRSAFIDGYWEGRQTWQEQQKPDWTYEGE